ncbi:MAG: hypothetical protein WDN28_16555 [Chthoniobacter sp.]
MRTVRRKRRSTFQIGLVARQAASFQYHKLTAHVHLTDEEWNELRELTHVDDAEGAVRSALSEYRRFARRMQLKALSGQVTMEDNWRVMEDRKTDAPDSR